MWIGLCIWPSYTLLDVREALVALHDPAAWTTADAEAFWRSAEKARFN